MNISRTSQSGTYCLLSHEKGEQNSFYYERDTSNKKVNLKSIGSDFRPSSSRHSRKSSVDKLKPDGCQFHKKNFKPNESSMSAFSNRTRSLEVTERLTGSTAFQMPNRHRHCKGMECQHEKFRHNRDCEWCQKGKVKHDPDCECECHQQEPEAKETDIAALRFRNEAKAKVDSKELITEPAVAFEPSKGDKQQAGPEVISPAPVISSQLNTDNTSSQRVSIHTKHENHDTHHTSVH